MANRDKQINDALNINGDLTSFKVTDLKIYLLNRRLNVSGRKNELIERVKGAYKLKTLDISDRSKQCEGVICERFQLPCGGKESPPEELLGWTSDCAKVPEVGEKDVYNYVVIKKNSKRQMKSRVFFEDGHVHKVEVHHISDSSHCYVRAKVLPSFPTADQRKSPDYQPWILLSKVTGFIHSAYCNCTAGAGECCNHIGVLLFACIDISQRRERGELSSTSKPCVWSNYIPRKRKLTPRKSEEVSYARKAGKHHCARKLSLDKNHYLNKINGCTVNSNRFKARLEKENVNVGWLKNYVIEKTLSQNCQSYMTLLICLGIVWT